jgi:hypothetical protein
MGPLLFPVQGSFRQRDARVIFVLAKEGAARHLLFSEILASV